MNQVDRDWLRDWMLAMVRDHENRLHPEIKKRELPAGCNCCECDASRKMGVAARLSHECYMREKFGVGSYYRWRSIKDSVPPEDELVLLRENTYSEDWGLGVCVFVGRRECNKYRTAILGPDGKRWEVTPAHWMPIPPLDETEMKS